MHTATLKKRCMITEVTKQLTCFTGSTWRNLRLAGAHYFLLAWHGILPFGQEVGVDVMYIGVL